MKPSPRARVLRDVAVRPEAGHVLYWMNAARRTRSSHALDRAIDWARELGRPLWVLEGLRFDHEHASPRHHGFAIRGMADNAAAFAKTPIGYFPHVESRAGEARGLLRSFAERACVVVTDDAPVVFVRDMVQAAATKLPVRVEIVDGVGLVPMAAPDRCFSRAHDFRRWLQKNTDRWLGPHPRRQPLRNTKLPPARRAPIDRARWRPLPEAALADPEGFASRLGLAHDLAPIAGEGGSARGRALLKRFTREGLPSYADRNQPSADVTSGLSPYLHWGHVGAHEVFAAVLAAAPSPWSPQDLADVARGQREGWWGLPPAHEGFLDQLLTWRELGHNFAWHHGDPCTWDSLPAWARATLDAHAGDPRPWIYDLATLEAAATHDPIWNAAQRQLVQTGRMHNYLRMLWGKKILHWSPSPRAALDAMIVLNDRYALDGRDPNSYSGIGWVLGRYDRPWGPERPVFGTIRYMSSDATRRKLRLGDYLERYGPTRRARP